MLGRSPVRVRYLQPYDEYARGGAGAYVVDASIDRIERNFNGYRVVANGTRWSGELEFEADDVIAATGFSAALADLPRLGVATVADGRIPAQTDFWESVSVPGIYFAGNATQGSPGLRKHGVSSNSTSVNGFRYNARLLARHLAETHFGVVLPRPTLALDEVVPFLLGELARAPELWIQKGYLARVVTLSEERGVVDDGILPLAHFVQSSGEAAAVTIEMDGEAGIRPVVYVRRDGRLSEHALSPHPVHAFEKGSQRRELAAALAPVLT